MFPTFTLSGDENGQQTLLESGADSKNKPFLELPYGNCSPTKYNPQLHRRFISFKPKTVVTKYVIPVRNQRRTTSNMTTSVGIVNASNVGNRYSNKCCPGVGFNNTSPAVTATTQRIEEPFNWSKPITSHRQGQDASRPWSSKDCVDKCQTHNDMVIVQPEPKDLPLVPKPYEEDTSNHDLDVPETKENADSIVTEFSEEDEEERAQFIEDMKDLLRSLEKADPAMVAKVKEESGWQARLHRSHEKACANKREDLGLERNDSCEEDNHSHKEVETNGDDNSCYGDYVTYEDDDLSEISCEDGDFALSLQLEQFFPDLTILDLTPFSEESQPTELSKDLSIHIVDQLVNVHFDFFTAGWAAGEESKFQKLFQQ